MAVAEEHIALQAHQSEQPPLHFTEKYLENWCATCEEFLAWEREHILKAERSPVDMAEHRQSLKWLLRFTRMLKALVSDPEFPHPSAVELLDMKLWQLDQSWKMLYQPLVPSEADRILAEVFPNEP